MVIDTIAGTGYGVLASETAFLTLDTVQRLGQRQGRLTLEVGLTGQPDGQPLGDERCVYLGRNDLRELIIAAAKALAEIEWSD